MSFCMLDSQCGGSVSRIRLSIEPLHRDARDVGFGEAIVLTAVAGAVAEQHVVAGDLDGGVAVPAVRIVKQRVGGSPGLAIVFGNGGSERGAFAAERGIDLA